AAAPAPTPAAAAPAPTPAAAAPASTPALSPAAGRGSVFEPLRSPAFRRILAAAALLGAATIGDAFVYLLLQRRLDVGVVWFPLLPLGAAAVYLLLAVPAGRLADRVGRRVPFLCGHGALLAAYLLLLTPINGTVVLALVLVLVGAFYASTDGVLMAIAGPLLPAARRASGLALLQTGQAVARLIAAAGFGAAWTLWGPRPALAAAATAMLTALVLARAVLPRTEQERQAP
ncbi:MFS transporter, partial [Streptomyces pristinaespiralis]